MTKKLWFCIVLLLTTLSVNAQLTNLLVNGSFEDPVTADGTDTVLNAPPSGWLGWNNGGAYIRNPAAGYWATPTDGENLLYYGGGAIQQTTNIKLQSGVTYKLVADVWRWEAIDPVHGVKLRTWNPANYDYTPDWLDLAAVSHSTLPFMSLGHVEILYNGDEIPAYLPPTKGYQLNIMVTVSGYGTLVDNFQLYLTEPAIACSGAVTVAEENETSGIYFVNLETPPVQDNVVIDITTDGQVNVSPSQITFTTGALGNWKTKQPITVTAADDTATEALLHSSLITHTVTSTDPNYAGMVQEFTVSVQDNDAELIIEAAGPLEVREKTLNEVTYTVKLSGQPSTTVLVDLSHDARLDVDPPQLTYDSGNYDTPQTVTVSAVDDDLQQDYQAISTIQHVAAGGEFEGVTAAVDVTVFDDECGSWGFQQTDFNQDCTVDLADFAVIAAEWLTCTWPDEPGCNPI